MSATMAAPVSLPAIPETLSLDNVDAKSMVESIQGCYAYAKKSMDQELAQLQAEGHTEWTFQRFARYNEIVTALTIWMGQSSESLDALRNVFVYALNLPSKKEVA